MITSEGKGAFTLMTKKMQHSERRCCCCCCRHRRSFPSLTWPDLTTTPSNYIIILFLSPPKQIKYYSSHSLLFSTKHTTRTTTFMNSMYINPRDTSNWLFDYGLMEDISAVSGVDFPAPAPATIGFSWPSPALNCSSNARCVLICHRSFGYQEKLKETDLTEFSVSLRSLSLVVYTWGEKN